jgi:hypothetical protein
MDKRHVFFPIIFIVNQSEAAIVPFPIFYLTNFSLSIVQSKITSTFDFEERLPPPSICHPLRLLELLLLLVG